MKTNGAWVSMASAREILAKNTSINLVVYDFFLVYVRRPTELRASVQRPTEIGFPWLTPEQSSQYTFPLEGDFDQQIPLFSRVQYLTDGSQISLAVTRAILTIHISSHGQYLNDRSRIRDAFPPAR